MATTVDRTSEPATHDEPVAAPAGLADVVAHVAGDVRAWWQAPLSKAWSVSLAVAWLAIFPTALALEPTPDDADAATPAFAGAVLTLVLVGFVVMAVGLWRQQRLGAAASLASAVGLLVVAIACPVSGHHSTLAAWWWFELAGTGALIAMSRAAIRSGRRAAA